MSRRAYDMAQEFTQFLAHLDRSEVVNTDTLQSWIDEDRETG
jgi:hypothetical protein